MIPEYWLDANDVRHQTMKTLTNNISLHADGYLCTTEMLFDIIVKASAEQSSVEAACADLEQVADSNTVREYLNTALDINNLRQQEEEMNATLAESIPTSMKRNGVEVAIDFHDEPFYGKRPELRAVACRGRAKKGTTRFIRIASAYVVWRQVRLTLAVRYVLPGESTLSTVKHLLNRVKSLEFIPQVLYLDKGFDGTDIVDYLTKEQVPAIIACAISGKEGGTRALCRGRRSYRTGYTFTNGTPANIALVPTFVPDKTGQRRRKWLAYIVIHLDWTARQIYQRYRRRFGIECSYRLMRRVRATTTSRNPAVRFFLLGIGLVLVNTWVLLRWEFARALGRGPRRVKPDAFRFHQFTRLLIRSIEAIYDAVMGIPTQYSPQSVIY
jgi:hypothetical protein